MADRFDVVAVRTHDKRSVVVRMIDPADTRWTVVLGPGLESGGMERVNLRAGLCHKCDVHRVLSLGMRAEPELRLAILSKAGPTLHFPDERRPEASKACPTSDDDFGWMAYG